MPKLTLSDVTNLGGNPISAQQVINTNSDRIEAAMEKTLSRDGSTPNQMESDFDMNNYDILNAAKIHADSLLINGTSIDNIIDEVIVARDQTEVFRDESKLFRDQSKIYRDETLDAASNAVSQGNVPIYSTRNSVQSLNIPTAMSALRTNGYHSVGDGGGALYKRVGVEPTHAGKVKSSDGTWWELSGGMNIAEFGPLGGIDDAATWQKAADYVKMFGPRPLTCPPGRYNISAVDFGNADVFLNMQGVELKSLVSPVNMMFSGMNVHIDGLSWDGQNTSPDSMRNMNFNQCQNVTLIGLNFRGGYYGAFMDKCGRVHVERCYGDGAKRWHIYTQGARELVYAFNSMHNGEFDGLKGGGVETAPWVSLDSAVIIGNISTGNKRDGIDLAFNMSSRVIIANNISYNNEMHGVDFKIVYGTTGEVGRAKIHDNYHEVDQASAEGNGTGGFGVHIQAKPEHGLNTRWVEVCNNTAYSRQDSTNVAAGVYLVGSENVWVHHNRSRNYAYGTRLNGGASNNTIEFNREENALRPVSIDNSVAGILSNNIVRNNTLIRRENSTNGCVTTSSDAVDTQIYDNEFICDDKAYSIIDNGSGTMVGENFRGFSDGFPTGRRVYIGDTWRQKTPSVGMPEKWTANASASTSNATNVTGMNQRGYRRGAGSPVGSVAPRFVGERYLQEDNPNQKWWTSFGTGVNNWVDG